MSLERCVLDWRRLGSGRARAAGSLKGSGGWGKYAYMGLFQITGKICPKNKKPNYNRFCAPMHFATDRFTFEKCPHHYNNDVDTFFIIIMMWTRHSHV